MLLAFLYLSQCTVQHSHGRYTLSIANSRLLQSVLLLSLQCDDLAEGSQTAAEKSRVCSSYPESQLYLVTDNVTGSQQLDLALAKGCVVAVIKESDPMANRDRWFIDNGGLLVFF